MSHNLDPLFTMFTRESTPLTLFLIRLIWPFKSQLLVNEMCFNPLTAGVAYIRVFIFY